MLLKALYILGEKDFELIYGLREQEDIAQRVQLLARPQTASCIQRNPQILAATDVIFSGWGMPRIDEAFLNAAPRLRAIFYGAGAISSSTLQRLWDRGIVVTTAQRANAVPVAEYTLATILFSLKHGWRLMRETRARQTFVERNDVPGCFRRTVGLISLGVIARVLLDLLRPFDLDVLVFDPFVTSEEAQELGVEKVSLEELFRRSHVASLHTPLLPETHGIITGAHLAAMPRGATFINTARGAVVRQEEMIEVAVERQDLQFVLDVTDPLEPPVRGSPLYLLPNIVLTPHLAGSAGKECQRMGRYMVEELDRYLGGQPLKWQITPQMAARRLNLPPTALHAQMTELPRVPTLISNV